MPEYTLTIPNWHPTRLNQLLTHWAVANKRKKSDYQLVWGYAHTLPKARGKRRLELTIILGPGQRAADPDAYFKVICDALVKLGLLTDDNRQGVELAPVIYRRGKEKATIIRLTDM